MTGSIMLVVLQAGAQLVRRCQTFFEIRTVTLPTRTEFGTRHIPAVPGEAAPNWRDFAKALTVVAGHLGWLAAIRSGNAAAQSVVHFTTIGPARAP